MSTFSAWASAGQRTSIAWVTMFAVRCPADAIPQAIEVDLSGLEINHSRHLSDITLPPGVQPLSRADQTLVTIVPPSGYAEELKAAAEAAATAATAAAAAAAAPAA